MPIYQGHWLTLHQKSAPAAPCPHTPTSPEAAAAARHWRAETLAALGEISRASRTLESEAPIVAMGEVELDVLMSIPPPPSPLDDADLTQLADDLHAREDDELGPDPISIGPEVVLRALHTSARDAGSGGSRMRTEHLTAIVEGGDSSRLPMMNSSCDWLMDKYPQLYDLTSVAAVPHH